MKKFFLVLGVAVSAGAAWAQEVKNYDVSVFDNYQLLDITNKQTAATTVQKANVAFPGFTVATDKLNGMAKDIFGKSMAVPGNTINEKAVYLMNNQLRELGVISGDWQKINETVAPHASFTYYEETINGHKVAFSRLSFRFTPDGKLQRIMMDNYGQPAANATAKMSRNSVLTSTAMTSDLSTISITTTTVDNDWVWFPVPATNGYELKAAWPFSVWGTDIGKNMPVQLNGYIDAETGAVLYRKNEVKEDINLVVKGTVYKNGFTSPTSDEPLANLEVNVNSSSLYTNVDGIYSNNGVTIPETATLSLTGKWSTVMRAVAPLTPDYNYLVTKDPDTFLFDGTVNSTVNQVNAYYHVNRVHDFVKGFLPSVTGIDISLPTKVDVTSPVGCNAFYSGSTINFYAENGTCNDFANVGDIVYHEFGHFVSDLAYRQFKGSGMRNGGLNEGNSDVWAMGITRDAVLGKGAFKNGSYIRAYNTTPKVYPMDITSEVHANGEVIAGAWWDVGVNIGSIDTMSKIFAKTYFDVPDGPEGTEGDVYHQVLVSALINDDNDANLANGTPHFNEIVKAFARHGIYLFGIATLDHKELAHQQAGQPIPVAANLTTTTAQKDGPLFQSLKLVYRNRTVGTWDTLAMNNLGAGSAGGINFDAQIPAQPLGDILDYYFVSYDILNNCAYTFPNGFNTVLNANRVTIPYQFGVGINQTALSFDFETAPDSGWIIGNASGDNATSGKWVRATPIASYWKPNGGYSFIAQTDKDHTTGTGQCLVTGNATSTNADFNSLDVDNGKTSVISPLFDLTSMVHPIIEYYRWYANDRGGRDTNPRTDMFQAQVRDEQSAIWKTVDATYQSDYNWRRRIFSLFDYWPTSKRVYLRFIAADDVFSNVTNNGQGNVEAAIDDIFIYDIFPTTVGNKPAPVKLQVYPNPANNTVNVTVGEATTGVISIADLTGRVITTQNMDVKATSYTFNTSALAAGTYMLMIKTSNTIQTHKVAVAH